MCIQDSFFCLFVFISYFTGLSPISFFQATDNDSTKMFNDMLWKQTTHCMAMLVMGQVFLFRCPAQVYFSQARLIWDLNQKPFGHTPASLTVRPRLWASSDMAHAPKLGWKNLCTLTSTLMILGWTGMLIVSQISLCNDHITTQSSWSS